MKTFQQWLEVAQMTQGPTADMAKQIQADVQRISSTGAGKKLNPQQILKAAQLKAVSKPGMNPTSLDQLTQLNNKPQAGQPNAIV